MKENHEIIFEYVLTQIEMFNHAGKGNIARMRKADRLGIELIKRGLLTEDEHEAIMH